MLKQVTELSAQLVEADRLIDKVDDLLSDFVKGKSNNTNALIISIEYTIRKYRLNHPSTVPDENWNVLEQEEKETLER
jgi:hypothetical protein